jgi:tetratricopeptide (TPR) repeat protein
VNVFTRADGLGGYLQAAAGFAKAAEANPRDPNIYFYWGMADLKAADEMPVISRQYVEKAIEHFEQGIRLYPPHPYMAMWLGRSCDALQRYDEAGRWFATALRWGNGSREVHHKYGDHLVFTKRPAEALPHFVAAMHRYPRESLDRLELQAKINYCMAEAKRGSAPVPEPAETP